MQHVYQSIRRTTASKIIKSAKKITASRTTPRSLHRASFNAIASAIAVLMLNVASQNAMAQSVIVTGPSTPTQPSASSSWDLENGTLVIGGSRTATGYMSILNGGKVYTGEAYVGDSLGGRGEVTIDGIGSLWNTTGSTSSLNNPGTGTIYVGLNSTGIATISNGGKMISKNLYLGYNPGSATGYVTVTGAGSVLEVGQAGSSATMAVGYYGSGELTISNGALFNNQASSTLIGYMTGAKGKVTVSGNGTQWINPYNIILGYYDNAEGHLIIEDGALVVTGNVVMSRVADVKSILELKTGGILELGQLQNFTASNESNTSVYLDGGTLRATKSITNFIAQFTSLDLKTGGLTLDSNGFDIGTPVSFTGIGKIVKQGAGTLTLRYDSTYSGGTFVEQGTLIPVTSLALGTGDVLVGGSNYNAILQVNDNIKLTNKMTIANRGLLMGIGTVTSTEVQSGGGIAAGLIDNRIGTLTVDGNLTMQSGSTAIVYTNPDLATSNLIHVDGIANLSGRVLHIGNGEKFEAATTYTILTATGGINGTFEGLDDYYAFLDLRAIYGTNDVQLSWARNTTMFSDLAITPNQLAVAKDVETHANTGAIYSFVENLQDGQVPDALDSLSGEIHANMLGRLENVTSKISAVGSQYLFSDLPSWVALTGNWKNARSDGNAARVKQNTTGLYLGANRDVGNNGWRVGGLLGYSRMDVYSDARYSSSNIDNYSASVYAGKHFAHGNNTINVLGGLSYTHHSIDTSRNIPLISQQLKASYSAQTTQIFAEAGYSLQWDETRTIEPFAGLNIARQRVAGFHETGGFAALDGNSSNKTRSHMTLGVRGHSQVKLADKDVSLHATAGWRRSLTAIDNARTMGFSSVGSQFTISGVPLARNTALLSLQARTQLNRTAFLEMGYNAEFGSGNNEHAANIRVNWMF
jgi:outer membrane autotransporter protein